MAMSGYVFEGGTAVVTGAASGIGAALAEALADRRSSLALVDRDAEGLARVGALVRTRHPDLQVAEYVADLAESDRLAELCERVLGDFPAVTLLVNNAGVALGGGFHQISLDDFFWVMRVNFDATVRLTYAFLPALRRSPGSHLVNMSSVYGLVAPPGQAAYAASKFAVRGFTEALRHELPALGVGVTAVHPGGVRTRIAENARVGAGIDPIDAERAKRQFARLLTIEPVDAAKSILDGVARRKTRVLIGATATVPDLMARVAPGSYWSAVAGLVRLRRVGRSR